MRSLFSLKIVIELDSEGSECHGEQIVRANREDQVHQLVLVELTGEHRPRRISDPGVGEQLVDGSEHGPLERRPPWCLRTLDDPNDLVPVESGVPGEHHMLLPLVGRMSDRCHSEDEELALSW